MPVEKPVAPAIVVYKKRISYFRFFVVVVFNPCYPSQKTE